MTRILKYAAAVSAAGLLAVGMSVPSQAAHGRNAAAAIGFGAGALIGAAAASAANSYYGPYYGPGYYAPGPYYYDYGGSYAYEPAPVYVEPVPTYAAAPVYRPHRCWHVTNSTKGYGYYGAC